VQSEAWMYGTERMVKRMVELINEIWRGEESSVNWRGGVICPIYIKREKNRAENYRGITFLNTGYKLYVSVLSERMKRGKGSGAGQPRRIQKENGHNGQCVRKEQTEEERGKDVCTVRTLQGGVRQSGQRENVWVFKRERGREREREREREK
jgi:hypothetical protein